MHTLKNTTYYGHEVIHHQFENYLSPKESRALQGDLEIKYSTDELSYDQATQKILITTTASAKAQAEGAEIFSLVVKFYSYFGVEGHLSEESVQEYRWFFDKFVNRSGKQLIESGLSHTRYRFIPIPNP